MPLILGGQSATAAAGYSIDNSCRFDKPSSAFLNLTFVTPTNGHIWNYSCWVKRTNLGTGTPLWAPIFADAASPDSRFYFRDDDFRFDGYYGGGAGGYGYQTTQLFRDVSAWYHVCILWDDTQAVAANRAKLFINGTQVTAFAAEVAPLQDTQFSINTAIEHYIGRIVASQYTDCYMAQVCFIDGTVYTVSDFGEFNEDSPTIWQPIDVSELTFGNNGFLLDFADSADLGNDVSGKGNDWTSNGLAAVDQATDSPTNNFCTMDPVATTNSIGNTITFSEGNNAITNTSGGAWQPAVGTMAANAGKWYAEFKVTAVGSATKYAIIDVNQYNERVNFADTSRAYSYEYNAGAAVNNSNWDDYWGDTFTTGDIIGIAMDLDNMKLYFSKAGVWQDSGDPTSGATGTGTHTYFGGASNSANAAGVDWYAFAANFHNNSVTGANFGGSPAFAITAESGAGFQDGNGYGKFEYTVPSGYYAMCTKNLAEFGGN